MGAGRVGAPTRQLARVHTETREKGKGEEKPAIERRLHGHEPAIQHDVHSVHSTRGGGWQGMRVSIDRRGSIDRPGAGG